MSTFSGGHKFKKIFLRVFFASGIGLPEIFLHYYRYTMILQSIRIIVEDAGFETGTSAPEVWCSTNKPIKNATKKFN